MLFFGHIAVSLVLADATASDRTAAVAGNLYPDIIDKTGGWVLHVLPSGRWLAHGLPFCAASTLVAWKVRGGRFSRGFALGYLSHLVGDLYGRGRVPWLAPFTKPRRQRKPFRLFTRRMLLPEVIGALVTWRLLARSQ